MKNILYAIVILLITISSGCKENDSNLSIAVKDTATEYTFDAAYPLHSTGKLETYLNKEFANELSLTQRLDTAIVLPGGERFTLMANKGVLNIKFDKKNSTVTSYIRVKKLADGIASVLTEK